MRCAVLGDPVEHSLSPVPCTARPTPRSGWTGPTTRCGSRPAGWRRSSAALDDDVARAVADHAAQARGVPLLDLARRLGAGLAGAANTLLLDRDGGWHGLNTDVPGALAALRRGTDGPVERAVVLGGGRDRDVGAAGAGRAGLCPRRSSSHVTRLGRRDGRGGGRDTLGPAGRAVLPWPTSADRRADVVVSTVPPAAQTAELLAAVAEVPVVFDVLYDPWPTPLAAAAGRTAATSSAASTCCCGRPSTRCGR